MPEQAVSANYYDYKFCVHMIPSAIHSYIRSAKITVRIICKSCECYSSILFSFNIHSFHSIMESDPSTGADLQGA